MMSPNLQFPMAFVLFQILYFSFHVPKLPMDETEIFIIPQDILQLFSVPYCS